MDTHTLLWLVTTDSSLSSRAFEAIVEPNAHVLVSAVSAWEIATKSRIGKLTGVAGLLQDFSATIAQFSFQPLSISVEDGLRAGLLPGHHKDPFDRLLAAQCQAESVPIISNDKIFDLYGVRRIW